MKIRLGELIAIAGSVLFCIALPASSQTTINFTNINNPLVFGDGYVDPYDGTVTYNGTPVSNGGLIVCDDYKDEIYIPETWKVTAIQASSLNSSNIGNTLFGSAIGLDGYADVANLVADLLSPSSSQSTQADLSSAIWWITSGGQVSGGSYTLDGYSLDSAAVGYVTGALATYGPFGQGDDTTAANTALGADTNLWVLTPITGTQSTGGPPQEMWISVQGAALLRSNISNVPEGGTALIYLLLAGPSCFGVMFFNSRSRLGRSEAA